MKLTLPEAALVSVDEGTLDPMNMGYFIPPPEFFLFLVVIGVLIGLVCVVFLKAGSASSKKATENRSHKSRQP